MIVSAFGLKSENPFQKSMIITISILIILMLNLGFFVPIYETPYFVQMITFPNFIRFHFESILLILFKERCELTPIVFNSYGINESQLTSNLYFLIIEVVVLRIIGFIVTLFQSNSNYFLWYKKFL